MTKHPRFKIPFPGIYDLVIVLICSAFFTHNFDFFAGDPGVGWHLRTGEYIETHRAVPSVDPFLALPPNTPPRAWICDQWLSDLLVFLSYEAGGWPLSYFFLTFIWMYTFLIFLRKSICDKAAGGVISSLLAVLVVVVLAQIHFIFRPVIFSFLFFALISSKARAYLDPLQKITAHGHFSLFILFFLWANLHPSFLLGLTLLAMSLACRCSSSGKIQEIFLPLFFCFLATLLNPNGIALHAQILSLTSSPYFMNLNEEWKPVELTSHVGITASLLFFSSLTGAFLSYRNKRKAPEFLFNVLSSCCFFFLALKSIRIVPLFAIVLAPVFATALSSFGKLVTHQKLIQAVRSIESRELRSSSGRLGLALSIALLSLAVFVREKAGELGPPLKNYPYGIMNDLKKSCDKEKPCTVLASPDLGGFITLTGYPFIKAFLDDRNSLLGEEAYKTFLNAARNRADLLALGETMKADYVVVTRKKRDEVPQYELVSLQPFLK